MAPLGGRGIRAVLPLSNWHHAVSGRCDAGTSSTQSRSPAHGKSRDPRPPSVRTLSGFPASTDLLVRELSVPSLTRAHTRAQVHLWMSDGAVASLCAEEIWQSLSKAVEALSFAAI